MILPYLRDDNIQQYYLKSLNALKAVIMGFALLVLKDHRIQPTIISEEESVTLICSLRISSFDTFIPWFLILLFRDKIMFVCVRYSIRFYFLIPRTMKLKLISVGRHLIFRGPYLILHLISWFTHSLSPVPHMSPDWRRLCSWLLETVCAILILTPKNRVGCDLKEKGCP